MDIYSGQGKLYAAKRDLHGNAVEKFFCGNVPKFTVNFLTGEVEFFLEELKTENLEIICGSALKEVPTDLSLLGNWISFDSEDAQKSFRASHPQMKMFEYDVTKSAPFEYVLQFEGVNTATSHGTTWKHFVRVALFRVVTNSGQGFQLISDDFACIKIVGEAKEDETKGHKRGKLWWVDIHKESVTGMRLTDTRKLNEMFA